MIETGRTAAFVIGLAAAPATSLSAQDDDITLGLAAIDLQNSFFVRMKEASDVAAQDYGVSAIWQSAEGSLEKPVAITENFVNQRVDAILVDPLDKNALIPVIGSATEAGIPVITMGNEVEARDNCATLDPDYENIGIVARALGGEEHVGLLVGTRGKFVSDTREQGFVDAVGDHYPKVEIVGIEPTAWDLFPGPAPTVWRRFSRINPAGVIGTPFEAKEAAGRAHFEIAVMPTSALRARLRDTFG